MLLKADPAPITDEPFIPVLRIDVNAEEEDEEDKEDKEAPDPTEFVDVVDPDPTADFSTRPRITLESPILATVNV